MDSKKSTPRGGPAPKKAAYSQPYFNDSNIEQTLVDTTMFKAPRMKSPEIGDATMNDVKNVEIDVPEKVAYNQPYFNDSNIEQTLVDTTVKVPQVKSPEVDNVATNNDKTTELVSPEKNASNHSSTFNASNVEQTPVDTTKASQVMSPEIGDIEMDDNKTAILVSPEKNACNHSSIFNDIEREELYARIAKLEENLRQVSAENLELSDELARCMKSLDEVDSLESELLKYKVKYAEVCDKLDALK